MFQLVKKDGKRMKWLKIKKQSDFQKLFAKGKRFYAPTFTLLYMPSETLWMGISVGKKHGKAVKRNRLKRLLREAFKNVQPLKKGGRFIFLPKPAEKYAYRDFENQLRCLMEKEKFL